MVELTRTSDASLRELGRRCPLLRLLDSSSDINVLETSHRTRVPKLGGDGVREVWCTMHELRTCSCSFYLPRDLVLTTRAASVGSFNMSFGTVLLALATCRDDASLWYVYRGDPG